MRCLLTLVLAVTFTVACDREAIVTYNQPPAGSYTIVPMDGDAGVLQGRWGPADARPVLR